MRSEYRCAVREIGLRLSALAGLAEILNAPVLLAQRRLAPGCGPI